MKKKIAELERKNWWLTCLSLCFLAAALHEFFATFLSWYILNWQWIEPLYTLGAFVVLVRKYFTNEE